MREEKERKKAGDSRKNKRARFCISCTEENKIAKVNGQRNIAFFFCFHSSLHPK